MACDVSSVAMFGYRMFKFLRVVQPKIEGRGPGDLVPQIGNNASSSSYS